MYVLGKRYTHDNVDNMFKVGIINNFKISEQNINTQTREISVTSQAKRLSARI